MTTNAVTVTKPNAVADLTQWTPDQMRLITEVVAKGATRDELQLFLYRCNNMGLDPLKPGQIHFVKYGTSPGTIVVGIEGLRSIAERTGKRAGCKRGVIRDDKGTAIGGWAEVYRHDWKEPARAEVSLAEYSTNRGPWLKMPESMIQKVAEAASLRMAFPDALGGVYVREEMDQAEKDSYGIHPQQPEPGDGNTTPTHYTIPFGKYSQKSLEEVGPRDLASYIGFLERAAEKKGETIKGQVADFIKRAGDYIAAFENAPMDGGPQ